MMCPHTGIEVGKQLQANREFVGLFLGQTRHLLVHLLERSSKILHMMAYLVGNNVCIGKIAVGTQLAFHRRKERQVDIQSLIAAAIERSHLCRTLTASRLYPIGIEHHSRILILHTVFLENLHPYILCAGKNLLRELCQLLLLFGEFTLCASSHFCISSVEILVAGLLHYCLDGIASLQICHNAHNNDTDNASKACLPATAHSTAIIYIRAFASSV